MIGLGVSIPETAVRHRVDAGGGGGGYVAKLVSFDENSTLGIASLTASDSFVLSVSGWVSPDALGRNCNIFFGNSNLDTSFYINDIQDGMGRFALDVLGEPDASNFVVWQSERIAAVSVKHHLIVSADLNHPSGERKVVGYLDGVKITSSVAQSVDAGDGSVLAKFNGIDAGVPILTDYLPMSAGQLVGEVWVAPGQSLLNEAGDDIPLATLRKFIDADGKPVYLGANGEVPTGTAPVVCFSKNNQDATLFGENRGTGGTFTLTGSFAIVDDVIVAGQP